MSQETASVNLDGLASSTIAMVVRYGGRKYVATASEGVDVLRRVRALLRADSSDVVPLAHSDGLVWLTVSPGVDLSFSEIEAPQGQSQRSALKKLGLVS